MPNLLEFSDGLPSFEQVPLELLDHVSPRAALLWGYLYGFHRNGKQAFPSRRLIGEKLRCTSKTATRLVAELVEKGLLTVRKRESKTNVYTVQMTFLSRGGRQKCPGGGDKNFPHTIPDDHTEIPTVSPGPSVQDTPKPPSAKKTFLSRFCRAYRERFGSTYHVQGMDKGAVSQAEGFPDAEQIEATLLWLDEKGLAKTPRAVLNNWQTVRDKKPSSTPEGYYNPYGQEGVLPQDMVWNGSGYVYPAECVKGRSDG